MNILFITDIAPFPVYGGERLRTYGLLKVLTKIFDKVVAVTGTTKNKSYSKAQFKSIDFYEFDFDTLLSQNRYINYLKKFRKDKKLCELLKKLLENNNIDIAYIDYHYYGQYINFFKSKGIPTIYGTHNVQSKLLYQRPTYTLKNKLSNFLEYSVYQLHERYFFKKANAIIAVSENDRQYYKNYIQASKIFVIPNFLIEEDYSLDDLNKKDYIIMTANFFTYANIAGLEWFVKNIWNNEIFKNEKLLLVGIGSDIVLEELKKKQIYSNNIKAIGSVDDLKPYIAQAKISIVPLLHGSGTRLKCIEAMALKTQLLSTGKGAEGVEHEGTIIIADTPELFTQNLKTILDGKIDYTQKGYDIFMKIYSLEPNISIFRKIIQKITSE